MDIKPRLAETGSLWDRGWPQTPEDFELLTKGRLSSLVGEVIGIVCLIALVILIVMLVTGDIIIVS